MPNSNKVILILILMLGGVLLTATPVGAVTYTIAITFQNSTGDSVTSINAGENFNITAAISSASALYTLIAHLDLPSGFSITIPYNITDTGTEGASSTDVPGGTPIDWSQYDTHFYELDRAKSWYSAIDPSISTLAAGNTWTTRWNVTAPNKPGIYNITVRAESHRSVYDTPVVNGDIYRGKNSTSLTVTNGTSVTVGTNQTRYRLGEAVKINGSRETNAIVNVTITKPNGYIANETTNSTTGVGNYIVTYTLNPTIDLEGIYKVEVIADDGAGGYATDNTTFRVGNLSLRSTPETEIYCAECHDRKWLFGSYWEVYYGPPYPYTHHPGRPAPGRNPGWVHPIHLKENSEFNNTRIVGEDTGWIVGGGQDTMPGQIGIMQGVEEEDPLTGWPNEDSIDLEWLSRAWVYGSDEREPVAYIYCQACHLNINFTTTSAGDAYKNYGTYSVDLYDNMTCSNVGDERYCHAATITGEHLTQLGSDNCVDCHGGGDISLNLTGSPTIPSCTKANCHGTGGTKVVTMNGTHYGSACVICHGNAHNATRPSCTDCHIAQNLTTTDAHTGGKANCTDCHGGKNHSTSVVKTPYCSKCHNTTATGVQQSITAVPPWGLSNTHGRANKTCDGCHNQQHNITITRPSCNNTGCHIANISGVVNYVGINATWNSTSREHQEDHSTGDDAFNYTIENHAYNADGWNDDPYVGNWGANCTQCHNNVTFNATNSTPDRIDNYTGTLIHSTESANVSPNYTSVSGFARWCTDCHRSGSSYYHTGEDCDNCHYRADGDDTYKEPAFHSASIEKTASENCTTCHDIGKSATNVNVSSMNTTGPWAVHRMLNNRTGDPGVTGAGATYTGDWNNRRCWACHGNGSSPGNDHPERYKNPWNCPDCHWVNSSAQGTVVSNYSFAPNVTEHIRYPYYDDICTNGTRKNAQTSPGNGTCERCHNNSIGVTNGSQFNTLTNYLLANVSHYATNATLMTPTTNSTTCVYCHNSTANGSKWGNATFLNLPGGHNDANSSSECHECHTDNEEQPTSFHNETLNRGTCKGCHFSYSYMSGKRNASFINKTRYATSVHGNQSVIDCEDCHTNVTDHELNYTDSTKVPPESGWKWCEDCHVVNQSISKRNRHNITSYPQFNWYNATYSAVKVTNCRWCHNATIYDTAITTYNRSSGKDCRFCHTFPDLEPGGD